MNRRILITHKPQDSKSLRILEKLKSRLQYEKIDFLISTQLSEINAQGFSDLVVIGGDGTLNHTINQLSLIDLPIGIIPAGSGNDFIKSVNIGNSLQEHIETALNGSIRHIDLGKVNNHYFINGLGLGFDGQIAHEFNNNRTFLRGHAAYYYHVLKVLGGYKPKILKFEIDGKPFEEMVFLFAIMNGTTFGGGFKLGPHARLDDGKFAICLIKNLKPLKRFLNLGLLKDGTHDRLEEVEFLEGSNIKIHHQPEMIAHIDGEVIGTPPFEVRVLRRELILKVGSLV
ncbi:MAG: diacylglycerol kinase family lipid kinase [Cyclobacteriaceae bacterium]